MGKLVVVDIGGSGTRMGIATKKGVTSIQKMSGVRSTDALAGAVGRLIGGGIPSAVAVSAPGIIKDGSVQLSRNAGWLVGDTVGKISSSLGVRERNVHVISDGEAHAMALRSHPDAKFGAINIAIGTSVGFGAIDSKGSILRSLTGDSWDLGNFELNTRAEEKSLWHALGGEFGFKELCKWADEDGMKHFGYRLGGFAVQMAHLFRPRTVGLSGGVIKHHWNRIKPGFYDEFSRLDKFGEVLAKPSVIVLDHEEAALTGLATLF